MTVNDPYSGSYRDVDIHRMMLHDVVRTEAYERALLQAVTPGCQVMDFGCGTGVLSIFASRAGAKKVYAVDESIFIQKAHDIAKRNKIENVFFYHNDHKNLKLDAKVDILVSEWMGHFLFCEAMLGPLLHLRDKYLIEGGTMIPGKVSLHAGLVTDDYFYEDISFLQQSPYGIDFGPIADALLCQTHLENVTPKQILDTTANLGTFDLHTLEAPPKELKGTVVPSVQATVYGFCGWFSAHLVEGIDIGTGPDDPPTHWSQIYFSFDEPLEVKPGVELTIRITLPEQDYKHEPAWYWSISDGTRTIEMNDIEHRRQLDPFLPYGLVNG
jgi:SAM-dependent methyltransferase